jgi:GNAT superfamily N-acetyltransferase
MIDPTVRRARPADPFDAAQLRDLEREARGAVAEQRGGARWLAEHPAVGDEWSSRTGSALVWVAHIDDVLVGYIVAEHGEDDVVRVLDVWVTPPARELGFGDELLGAVVAEAGRRGAVGVEGAALPGDRQTKNLYERAGIVARLIVTYKPLAAGASAPSTPADASR